MPKGVNWDKNQTGNVYKYKKLYMMSLMVNDGGNYLYGCQV